MTETSTRSSQRSGVLTISGLPGSGTSTVSQILAQTLQLERLDGGSVFRAMAAERGLSLHDFSALAESDPNFDHELDRRLLQRASQGGVLLESRLAGWLTRQAEVAAVRVWIACDDNERAIRVAQRDGDDPEAARRVNDQREASERVRYHQYYNIDLLDLSIYDLVVDSTEQPPEQLVAQILTRFLNDDQK